VTKLNRKLYAVARSRLQGGGGIERPAAQPA